MKYSYFVKRSDTFKAVHIRRSKDANNVALIQFYSFEPKEFNFFA